MRLARFVLGAAMLLGGLATQVEAKKDKDKEPEMASKPSVPINKDPYPHTATSTTGAFDSRNIAPEKSWRYVVRKTGEFRYLCAIHPSMKGVILVK